MNSNLRANFENLIKTDDGEYANVSLRVTSSADNIPDPKKLLDFLKEYKAIVGFLIGFFGAAEEKLKWLEEALSQLSHKLDVAISYLEGVSNKLNTIIARMEKIPEKTVHQIIITEISGILTDYEREVFDYEGMDEEGRADYIRSMARLYERSSEVLGKVVGRGGYSSDFILATCVALIAPLYVVTGAQSGSRESKIIKGIEQLEEYISLA